MKLTKKEAISRHRLMWNWIANETLRRNKLVEKKEAFEHFGWKPVNSMCWCCEYNATHVGDNCSHNCIVKWPGISCMFDYEYKTGLYEEWNYESDPKKSAELARKIANLPERKDV